MVGDHVSGGSGGLVCTIARTLLCAAVIPASFPGSVLPAAPSPRATPVPASVAAASRPFVPTGVSPASNGKPPPKGRPPSGRRPPNGRPPPKGELASRLAVTTCAASTAGRELR